MGTARLILLALVLGTVCAAAVGCGGGESPGAAGGSTIETSSLTKADFVKAANEICEKGSERYLSSLGKYLSSRGGGSKTEDEVAADAIRRTVLPEIERQNQEIEALGAPAGDQAQIEAFLTAQRRSIASLERRRSLSLNTDLDPAFRRAGKLARRYGLELCAYG